MTTASSGRLIKIAGPPSAGAKINMTPRSAKAMASNNPFN
jgi:hypothetical protein